MVHGHVPSTTQQKQDAHYFESKWHPQVAFEDFLAFLAPPRFSAP